MKRELERQGHRVSVFTADLDASSTESGIYQVRLGLRDRVVRRLMGRRAPTPREIFALSSVIAAGILRVHRRDPIDVLEMEESFGWFADVGRRTSLPILVKLHGPTFLVQADLRTSFARERAEQEGQALRLAKAIVSPSRFTLERTIEHYGLAPEVCGRAVNPLAMDEDTPLWRLEACERNSILFVGRFDLVKGADIMLKALQLALKHRRWLRLIFVGPDEGLLAPDGTKTYFETYCQSVFGSELRDRIDFRGPMDNHEVAKLRTRAMVTVVSSRIENQSYAILEAMFQGCPLVSTNAGACPETVVDGVTGRLAKSEDPDDFAAKIIAMVDDPFSAEAMGRAARRYVVEKHSPKEATAAAIDFYKRVIAIACAGC